MSPTQFHVGLVLGIVLLAGFGTMLGGGSPALPLGVPPPQAGVYHPALSSTPVTSVSPPWTPASGKSSPGAPAYHVDTLSRASTSCATSVSTPAWLAFDPVNGTFWVAASSCVDLITPNGTGYNLTASVPVGTDAFGVAVDNATNDVFVTNNGSANVTVISASNDSVIANIPVGANPQGVAFDWASGDVYVANNGSDNVSVISAATLSVVAEVAVGSRPVGVVADPSSREVFVANSGSANVTVLSDRSNRVAASVATGAGPYGVAWDWNSNAVYVSDSKASEISVINASTNSVIATIPVPSWGYLALQGVAYDPVNDTVWVGAGSTYAVVVNATDNHVVAYVGTDPAGVAVDPATNEVCVTNTANFTFECLGLAQSYWPVHPAAPASFWESGLGSGANWSVEVSLGGWPWSGVSSNGTNISFGLNSEMLFLGANYRVAAAGYVASPSTGTLTFGGSPLSAHVNVSFRPQSGVFPVYVNETGLPNGTAWNATVGSVWDQGTSASAVLWLANGSYNVSSSSAPPYVASPSPAPVTVQGASGSLNVTFAIPGYYTVRFAETGLTSATQWSVSLGSTGGPSTGVDLNLSVPNGTFPFSVYAFGWYPNPANGTVTVNGSNVSVPISFTFSGTTPYLVTFNETGLAPGTWWNAGVSGYFQASGTASLGTTASVSVVNGTYTYQANAAGYIAVPWSGNLTVHGAPVNQSIRFLLAPYRVTFVETGLPNGTYFVVQLTGQTGWAGLGSVWAIEPNGTFQYTIPTAAGEYPSPSSGSFTIAGSDVVVNVSFAPYSYPVVFTEHGLATGSVWSVSLAGALATGFSPSINFTEPNGTFAFSVTPISGYHVRTNGSVVVNGSAVYVTVGFSPTGFPLVFHETGLPNGTGWGVVLGSQVTGGLTSNLSFVVSDGSYAYVVLSVPGYVTGGSGIATVHGAATTVTVAFSPQTYPVVFIEFGLPAGSNWSVTVVDAATGFNQTLSTTGNALTLFLPNGTYTVSFTLPAGVTANVSSTQLTVDGHGTPSVSVHVVPPAAARPALAGTSWFLFATAAVVVLVVVLVGVAIFLGQRRPPHPPR